MGAVAAALGRMAPVRKSRRKSRIGRQRLVRRPGWAIVTLDPIDGVRDQPSGNEDADNHETKHREVMIEIANRAPKASSVSKAKLIADHIRAL